MDEHTIRFSFLSVELRFMLLVPCFSRACLDSCASCRLSGSMEERWIYHFACGSGKLCSGVVPCCFSLSWYGWWSYWLAGRGMDIGGGLLQRMGRDIKYKMEENRNCGDINEHHEQTNSRWMEGLSFLTSLVEQSITIQQRLRGFTTQPIDHNYETPSIVT